MSEPKPQQCILDPHRGLMYVKWLDDHESLIPLSTVRQLCPCVQCQEAREAAASGSNPLRVLPDILANPSTHPAGVEPLGNHALHIVWSDGHEAGIYTWAYLRSMCPCPACRS